jgi:SRSO17 transposase
MQHLLARAVWDEDGVRDDVRDYLVEHPGDPAAVLVVDETGDLKKGTGTVGVQRQRPRRNEAHATAAPRRPACSVRPSTTG